MARHILDEAYAALTAAEIEGEWCIAGDREYIAVKAGDKFVKIMSDDIECDLRLAVATEDPRSRVLFSDGEQIRLTNTPKPLLASVLYAMIAQVSAR